MSDEIQKEAQKILEIMKHFEYSQIPPSSLRVISKKISELADDMIDENGYGKPPSVELTIALEKLLEVKDWFTRARAKK